MPVAGGVQYVNIPVEIDTPTLRDIAQTTDGNFYRATSTAELKKIYKDIDKLEKSKFNVKHFAKRYEAYQPLPWVHSWYCSWRYCSASLGSEEFLDERGV